MKDQIAKVIAEYLDENLEDINRSYDDCEDEAQVPDWLNRWAFKLSEKVLAVMEQKTGWEDAPSWANYLAMDANGYWWWYEEKPQLSRDIWAFGGERSRKTLHKQDVAWNESLQARPK